MKNKKLLSVLCLLALAGCQPSSTSGSSSQSQGTSGSQTTTTPSASSSTQTPSSSSSTGGGSSSSDGGTTTPVKPELPGETREEFEAFILAGIESTLVYADMTQTSSNTQFQSFNFYTNAMVQHKQTFGKNHTEENPDYTENVRTYRTIKNGRYYEVTDNIKYPTNNTLFGYEIVEENANKAQRNRTDAETTVSKFFSHTMDGYFGRGTDIQNTVLSIFGKDVYKEESTYHLKFDSEYIGDTSAMKLYISHTVENPYMQTSIRPNLYSAEYTLDENGNLTNATFIQKVYNVNDYDTENHLPSENATPTSTSTYTYNFQYGELKAEETPAYDVDSMSYDDYSLKFYTDYGKTEEFTEDVFYTNTSYYLGVEGNPETASTDKIYVVDSTDKEVFRESDINGTEASAISFRKAGTTTLTFSNASGVTKQVTFNVEAPKPTEIHTQTWGAQVPSTLSVNEKAELPSCSLNPWGCDDRYEWVFVSGADYAELSYDADFDTHYITGKAAGKAVIKAVAVADPSVSTEEFEIEILAPLSEEELKSQMTSRTWACSAGDSVATLSFTETSGTLNFGKEILRLDENNNWAPIYAENETTYTFDYTFDYSTGSIVTSNETWSKPEDSQYNKVTINGLSISLRGGKISVDYSRKYTEDSTEDSTWDFTFALTSEELENKVLGTWLIAMPFGSNIYAYVDINEDKTGKFYFPNYSTDELTFTWEFDENYDIIISGLEGSFTIEYLELDWNTWKEVSATAVVTFGSKLDVEPILFASFTTSYTFTVTSDEEPMAQTVDGQLQSYSDIYGY